MATLTLPQVAYLGVIAVWSTTPLAIKWSNQGFGPMAALCLRLLIAAALLWLFYAVVKRRFWFQQRYIKAYAAAGLGIFPNMALVYIAANYIPSGLISLLFAMVPFFIGSLAWWLLGSNPFNSRQLVALVIAIAGLALVFADQLMLNQQAVIGLGIMMVSNVIFALSNVLLKKTEPPPDQFELATGAMSFALPGLLVSWAISEKFAAASALQSSVSGPMDAPVQAVLAISYLAIVGSIIGFAAYYLVLATQPLAAVAAIPLITPIAALWLGASLAQEAVSSLLLGGTVIILFALVIYDDTLLNWLKRRLKPVQSQAIKAQAVTPAEQAKAD